MASDRRYKRVCEAETPAFPTVPYCLQLLQPLLRDLDALSGSSKTSEVTKTAEDADKAAQELLVCVCMP